MLRSKCDSEDDYSDDEKITVDSDINDETNQPGMGGNYQQW